MSDGSNSRAIREFVAEADDILENLNLDLNSIADTDQVAPDRVNSLFRGAHSLKGIAGMFGFDDISSLAHQLENLLDGLRLGRVSIGAPLLEALYLSLETLGLLVGSKRDGAKESLEIDLQPLLATLTSLQEGDPISEDNPFAELDLPNDLLNVLTEYEEHRLQTSLTQGKQLVLVKVSFDLTTFDQELAALTDLLRGQGEVISTLPVSGDIGDKIGFQLLVGSLQAADELIRVIDDETVEVLSVGRTESVSVNATTVAKAVPAANETLATETVPRREEISEESGASLRSISRTVRVDIDKLDHLMNIVGELVLAKSGIAQVGQHLKEVVDASLVAELHKATRTLERRLEELQNAVMDVRMVPVAQLFEKMNRVVRRAANESGKQVHLTIDGAETELDKLIVEDLTDPLVHIVRNAIDHGVEAPDVREKAGKNAQATIALRAAQKGNHVVVEVSDDGQGIDSERVRATAVENSLISADAELSREQIFDLLFIPGFSTTTEVSDLSGRGVGMDVVLNNIRALSGAIDIKSEVGRGTELTITLPITLAIIKALIVETRGRCYAIPINAVLETLMVDAEQIETIERREVIELRQATLPLIRLSELFQLPAAEIEEERLFVVVVGLAERRMGVVVDSLLGQQDVVIKSLGEALSFVRGIAGAADLGNQQTVLVLDVGGLMSEELESVRRGHV